MRSRRAQSDGANVSLFPFLAVLLCTMGSLIVILVVLSKQVRAAARAEQAAQPVDVELDKKTAAAREELQWQIETLEQSLAQTAGQLENDRLTLSNLENAIRKLQAQIEQTDAAAMELARASNSTQGQQASARADLDRLKQRAAELAADLQRARHEAANRPQSYSIIPYEGKNKTQRRPMFIECTADAVILQPEGVKLAPSDFEEPLGPGNPLAAALRASREYLVASRRAANLPDEEPYPLIIVRPSGIAAYYGVRDAIQSWDADFGYELIGEDWKLDFPPADPRLAALQVQAISEGRSYQQRLQLAAPSKYGRATTYRAAPHRGGMIREGGMGGEGTQAGGAGAATSGRNYDRFGSQSDSAAARGGGSRHVENQGNSGGGGAAQGGNGGNQASGDQNNVGPGGTPQGSFQKAQVGRRENWGLPDASARSVAITRTVRAVCQADRLIILPERGMEGGYTVLLKPKTEDSVDEFVSQLWQHMKGWGIAGNGLYWRPILVLQVSPGGEQRARDMGFLLHNSGIDVREAGNP